MLLGLTLTIVAGVLGGSVLAPIKRMRRWPFHNSWAVYSLWAYFIMPWVVGFATVPGLLSIYPQVSLRTALICGLSGFGWGFAVVLFGVAVNLAGLTLASAIIYGASVAVGSLSPLLISHPERLATAQGALIVAANAVMVAGIVLSALAGKVRDSGGGERAAAGTADPRRFARGLAASLAAAILSSLFNIALAYGSEFNRLAIAAGASPWNAANAQWAFTVSFGYLPNLAVSLVVLRRERAWRIYSEGPASHWIWPPLMGFMWIGGTALYGSGAGALGSLGPVIGWPIYMSMMIIAGSFWGWLTGEWEHAPRRALVLLAGGIVVQIVAISMLSAVNR
jgi:L-rhamnose-H+ transport protein